MLLVCKSIYISYTYPHKQSQYHYFIIAIIEHTKAASAVNVCGDQRGGRKRTRDGERGREGGRQRGREGERQLLQCMTDYIGLPTFSETEDANFEAPTEKDANPCKTDKKLAGERC